jgi:nitrite reductase/ring-hydroxylating ferredoxin subunit
VQLAVDHDARANAGAYGEEDKIINTFGCACVVFSEGGKIHVIVHGCGHPKLRLEHLAQGNLTPAHQIRCRNHNAAFGISDARSSGGDGRDRL